MNYTVDDTAVLENQLHEPGWILLPLYFRVKACMFWSWLELTCCFAIFLEFASLELIIFLNFFLPTDPDFRSKQTSNKQFICCGLSKAADFTIEQLLG